MGWLGIAGPTASGKSGIALAIARDWPVEILSVDSALVYRGMDIGTAKPSRADRAAVAHHLIDAIEPHETYSAARFVQDVQALLPAIRARGRWPLLVGGTMMYFKALMDGLDAMPPADARVRADIDALARAEGWAAVHAQLAAVDPATAARLAPNDAQRLQRALEVWRLTGRPLSDFHRRGRPGDAKNPAPRDHVLVSLEPGSRAWLHDRIARRFDAMLAAGFLDEVRALRRRPELRDDLPAIRCVGYRQAWAALDACDPPDLPLLRERAIAATRQLAKRQLTWLRSMSHRERVAVDEADPWPALRRRIERHLGPPGARPGQPPAG